MFSLELPAWKWQIYLVSKLVVFGTILYSLVYFGNISHGIFCMDDLDLLLWKIWSTYLEKWPSYDYFNNFQNRTSNYLRCNFMDKFVSFLLANSCPVWPEICLLADLLAGRQICQRGQIRLLDIFYKEKGLFWGQNNKNI